MDETDDNIWWRMGWFTNDNLEWHTHKWNVLANHITSKQKIVIYGKPYIYIFLSLILLTWTKSQRKLNLTLLRHCRLHRISRSWYCYVTQTRILTSFWSIVTKTFFMMRKVVACLFLPSSREWSHAYLISGQIRSLSPTLLFKNSTISMARLQYLKCVSDGILQCSIEPSIWKVIYLPIEALLDMTL